MGLEFRWTFDDFDPPKVLRFSSRNCQAVQQSLLELLRAVPGFAQVQMLGSFCYERHRKTWQSHASHFKFRKDYRNILVSKAERERERCPEMPGENLGVSCACAVRTVILAVASCPRFGCVPWDAVSIVLLRGGQMLSGSSMFFMCLESSSTFQHDWHMQADMRACMFG